MSAVGGNALKPEFMSSTMKAERIENSDYVRVDQNQIVVKLEKGEGTLQIEKVGHVKKETVIDEPVSVDIALVKTEPDDTVSVTRSPIRIPTTVTEKSTDESFCSKTMEKVEMKEEPTEDKTEKTLEQGEDAEAASEKEEATSETVGHKLSEEVVERRGVVDMERVNLIIICWSAPVHDLLHLHLNKYYFLMRRNWLKKTGRRIKTGPMKPPELKRWRARLKNQLRKRRWRLMNSQ